MKEKFDQNKIDRIHFYLINEAQKNAPRYYEIYVDNLKVVPKTNDVNEFDSYQQYITEGVRELKILIYSAAIKSHWNKSHEFYFPQPEIQTQPPSAPVPIPALNGIDIEQRINEKISAERQRWEAEQMQKELEQTKKLKGEAEEYIAKLEESLTATSKELAECKSKKEFNADKALGIAEVALTKFLGPTDLKGVFSSGDQQQTTPVSEASFSKSTEEIPREYEPYIALLKRLELSFSQQELDTVIKILGSLIEKPDLLPTVADLLGISH